MKRLAPFFLLGCLLLLSAQTFGPNINAPGQIPGTRGSESATTGNVGEILNSASVSTSVGTFTVTIASPAVVTAGSHTATGIVPFIASTTGALPTGITAGTVYYTINAVPGQTFSIATTVANAVAGTAVNTSGTQSGVHTGTSNFAVTTATSYDIGGLSLTAGTWDVWMDMEYTPASTTVVSATHASISTTTATIVVTPVSVASRSAEFTSTGQIQSLKMGPFRVNLAATTTYFAVFRPTFTVSTMTFRGVSFRANRVR